MNPWILRIIIIILAIAFVPLLVGGIASLVAGGIYSIERSVHSIVGLLSLSGEERLEGMIRICLYLIVVTFLVKVLMRKW